MVNIETFVFLSNLDPQRGALSLGGNLCRGIHLVDIVEKDLARPYIPFVVLGFHFAGHKRSFPVTLSFKRQGRVDSRLFWNQGIFESISLDVIKLLTRRKEFHWTLLVAFVLNSRRQWRIFVDD